MKKAAFIILGLLCLYPEITAGTALVAGIFFALAFGNPFVVETKRWTSTLLQVAVVGLGFGMNLLVVGKVGFAGVGYTAITICLSMAVGLLLGRALRISKDASLLISAGTAICGGSAIAALAAAIRAESEDVSVSLATVFLLNAAALFIFPPLGHAMGFSEAQFGLWSALAVHDTSSVVGTAIQYGPQALEIGTTVKLARALWITPLTLLIGFIYSRRAGGEKGGKIAMPWFILGFVLASALVTWVPLAKPAGQLLATASRSVLVLTLFLIGSNLTRKTLQTVGFRPMLQGLLLWIVAGSTSLYAIHVGWIHL
ncbi:MAG: YeiH family protein [Bdellovibrionota bacterium]